MAGIAFAAAQPYLPALWTIPVFDEADQRGTQATLPLRLAVTALDDRLDFLRDLLDRAGQPIHAIFTPEPLTCELRIVPRELPPVTPSRDIVITPLMERVEQIIGRIARALQPCPTNPVLGELAGNKGRNVVSRALARLAEAGRLTIEIGDGMRRVVLAGGQATAWGPFVVKSHRPYSRRARGEAPPAKAERVDYQKVEGEALRYHIQPQKLIPTTPARTCQMPLWGNGERPALHGCDIDALLCGGTIIAGTSWCKQHVRVVFEERQPSFSRKRLVCGNPRYA